MLLVVVVRERGQASFRPVSPKQHASGAWPESVRRRLCFRRRPASLSHQHHQHHQRVLLLRSACRYQGTRMTPAGCACSRFHLCHDGSEATSAVSASTPVEPSSPLLGGYSLMLSCSLPSDQRSHHHRLEEETQEIYLYRPGSHLPCTFHLPTGFQGYWPHWA